MIFAVDVFVCLILFIRAEYFPVTHTWSDNSGDRHTFQMTLDSENTDVVLHTRIQAL